MKATRARTITIAVFALVLLGASCGGSGSDSAAARLAKWCPLASKIQDGATSMVLALSASPDAVKKQFDELNSTIDAARDSAPSEIADDAKVVNDFYQEIVGVVASHDYQRAAILTDPKVLQAINNPDFTSALGRVTQYVETNCVTTTSSTP
jgi:protein involved in sex pheromone biosynthesis